MARKKSINSSVVSTDSLQNNINEPIGKLTEEAYLIYGGYINNNRAICNLDGLKVSYRRLIYTSMGFPKGKLNPSLTLISAITQFSPHGVANLNLVNSALVRAGIFKGRGFFGSVSMNMYAPNHSNTVSDPSNERYLSSGLSDAYWELLEDTIKETPMHMSPQDNMEPDFIPLPLPCCMYMKDPIEGLGLAVKSSYPIFDVWSLYDAYINNDPWRLKSRVDLPIDYSNSELDKLWTTGKGRVTYVYKVSRQPSPDGKTEGVLFETKDGTGLFTPNFKEFSKLADEGKVYAEDVSDVTGEKYFIGRIPGARGITIEDIERLACKCNYMSQVYSLMVSDGQSCFRIPLYDWIDFTYKRYLDIVSKVNQKKIIKTEFNIAVLEALPVISDYIINKNSKATDKEVCDVFGFHPDVVKEVMQKPISYLRKNKDNTSRLKNLKDQLKELKKFDPVKYTEEIIKKL